MTIFVALLDEGTDVWRPVDTACEQSKSVILRSLRTTVSTKGHILVPAGIRRKDDIEPGQEFEIERIDRGEYLLKRVPKSRNKGLVKLLLSCPVKDWFHPLDRTETTDNIKLSPVRIMRRR